MAQTLTHCKTCGQVHQNICYEDADNAGICWPCRFKASTGINLNPTQTSPNTTKEVLSF
jgi:hypothetical protein